MMVDWQESYLRERLLAKAWSQEAVAYALAQFNRRVGSRDVFAFLKEAKTFASPCFIGMWQIELKGRPEPKRAQDLLKLALDCLGMPEQLTGTVQETQRLLEGFADIAPSASFWSAFSTMVALAFPGDEFVSPSGDLVLKRRVHQFRYVISAQQAQWVRDGYRHSQMTDAEALAAYLSQYPRFFPLLRWWLGIKPAYQIKSSARLHNKRSVDARGAVLLPDRQLSYNIKVLLGFHTEFILSDKGAFLNELELESPSLAGVINGASFNYGGGSPKAHLRLDVKTVSPYDPAFRRKLVKNKGYPFKNPNRRAYRSKVDRVFSDGNQALVKYVRRVQEDFRDLIRSYRRKS